MTQSVNPQIIATLADATRLNEGEGLLLARHPDFIRAVRPSMKDDEQEFVADALLFATESISLTADDEGSGASEDEDDLYIAPGTLDIIGIFNRMV